MGKLTIVEDISKILNEWQTYAVYSRGVDSFHKLAILVWVSTPVRIEYSSDSSFNKNFSCLSAIDFNFDQKINTM